MRIKILLISILSLMLFSNIYAQPVPADQMAPMDQETEHKHEDEIAQIRESRGRMYQSRARVTAVTRMTPQEIGDEAKVGAYDGYKITLMMLDGPYQGQEVHTDNFLYEEDQFKVSWKVGNTVLLGYLIGEDGNIYAPAIYSRDRSVILILLIVVFMASVIVLGRKQGVLSLVALMVTGLMVFLVFIPLVLRGGSPIFLAILVSVLSSIFTFLIISGWTFKTLSSSLGVLLGFLVSAILVFIFGRWLNITGIMNIDIVSLGYTTNLPLPAIMFSGILIGAVGAVMDVAISMASTVEELRKANPGYTHWELYTSALNVGKDLLGTMVNTLVMAYVGAALPFLLLIFLQYGGNTPVLNILNLEVITVEILRSIIGSLGMIATIPATAFIAAYLKTNHTEKERGTKKVIKPAKIQPTTTKE